MRATVVTILGFLLIALPARAELTPDEVAIVAMSSSHESRRVADYYAAARGVPKSQIFLLECDPGEVISRTQWDQKAQPAIRAWLAKNGLEGKIRCMVTTSDVPLKIGPRSNDVPEVSQRKAHLKQNRAARVKQIAKLVGLLNGLAGGEAKEPEFAADAPLNQMVAAFDAAMKEEQARRAKLPEAERKETDARFERVFLAAGGVNAVLEMVARQSDKAKLPDEATRRLEMTKAQLLGLQQGLQALANLPDTVARDSQMLNLLYQATGAMGCVRWIDEQMELLERNETYASFDSELSLLDWPEYPLFRWQPNPLHYAFDAVPNKRPAMMVARLSAPSSDLVMKLIDASIATEKVGLDGTVYLDARGMSYDAKKDQPGSYGQYDQSLRDLAERLKNHTKLKVVLDNESTLFQPGACPDAALYCGWYSLGKYVDAFDWKPGSVGCHLASMEAETLQNPKSEVWCNAMLRDGVAATLGPTYEPYLGAFPLPDDFFSLLLTGRYTLAEVYYRTTPFSSWVMVLVGDPLYNPFKTRPALAEDALPDRLRVKPAEADMVR
ncbi:MAG: TIGR03790 family protein [Pirellulales bacterium]|nr:TIGR03790 family protein [Pirellulales bacterium]